MRDDDDGPGPVRIAVPSRNQPANFRSGTLA